MVTNILKKCVASISYETQKHRGQCGVSIDGDDGNMFLQNVVAV
jgi:hypothetical protein